MYQRRRSLMSLIGIAAALWLSAAPEPALAQLHPAHPMDALTGAEIGRAVDTLRAAGYADENTVFPDFRLAEPPKEVVLEWEPGKQFTRKAFIITRRGGRVFEAVVDLDNNKVLSHTEIGGVQTSITQAEWSRARAITKADPRWQEAMRARGFENFDKISCAPLLPGHFPGDSTDKNRLLKVPCYDDSSVIGGLFGRSIAGVLAIVDVDADTVIDVVDTGVVKPPASQEDEGEKRTPRDPIKPILNLSPQGRNYTIKPGWQVNWQNWSFHLRIERRAGPVLSLVKYEQKGEKRMIAYQMALAEMFVPYMQPDPNWAFRTPMDIGEYGAGYTASVLRPGQDCPFQSTFINIAVPSDGGGQFPVERGLCIFERNKGEPLWRHAEAGTNRVRSRPTVELVVRMITTVGNYDYALDWVFSQNGNIKGRVGATGYLSVKTIADETAPGGPNEGELRFGTLVAPGTLAVNHDHFFSFRLDLDVNGTKNTLVRDVITPKAISEGKRRSLWVVEEEPVTVEGPIKQGNHENWRVINPESRTKLGHRPGIQIMPGSTVPSILSPDDPPQARAAFSAFPLWVSAFKPGELFAAGDYPNQSKGGEGLPAYVGDKESVEGNDLVLWYTVGFHHVPRAEDWPIMPTRWHEFTLRPFNFFNENPAIDLAPDFKKTQ